MGLTKKSARRDWCSLESEVLNMSGSFVIEEMAMAEVHAEEWVTLVVEELTNGSNNVC